MVLDPLAAYPPASESYDELLDAHGRPRGHWSAMLDRIAATPAQRIRERLSTVEREVREQGVTYNVYADPLGKDRPWDIDVLPMILPDGEWAGIEAAISQRARLLNRVLHDLYGEQALLREGLLPPALVYGHAGFLRPAHGMKVPGDTYLHLYAADLARSPDGQWWVMADRTQAPSGIGYALENRLIVSRVFPELYRDLRVARHAPFHAMLRDSIARLAPADTGMPLTVLLTPGPYNETYFEHALLSRYLGFPLVEGGDLTVRDGKVWMKTLVGLQRVHAIVRRLDEDYCDPLELRSDSALGVPGLTDCMRRGTVLMANALGAGVLEGGAMLGFLPGLCERLLDETLKMPSVATWWCGETAAMEDAFARLDSLVFKSASPDWQLDPVFGRDFTPARARAFRHEVLRHPGRYVAQELVRPSQAPALDRATGGRLSAAAVGLRVFAVATPGGYAVLPGGLTRVASGPDARMISMQRGGGSKDTWVLSPAPVNAALSLLRTTVTAAELASAGSGIPSRVAENLFWFGRYAQRCDDAARLLRQMLSQRLADAREDAAPQTALLALGRAFGMIAPGEDDDAALLEAASHERRPGGLAANLRLLAMVGFTLRDRLSMDNWRALNRLSQDHALHRDLTLPEALEWTDRAVSGLMTLSGFALDGMTRDTGWRFLSIGRRLERMSFMCLALQVAVDEGRDSGLAWLLELADSGITYRSRYMTAPEWMPVLHLLLLDGSNPRSVRFQADGVADYLARVEAELGPCCAEPFGGALRLLRDLAPADLDPGSRRLRDVLSGLRQAGFALSDRLTQQVFGHSEASRMSAVHV